MLETQEIIETAIQDAAELDKRIVTKRLESVRKNLVQIEGRERGTKYVQRLAGGSTEDPRLSRTVAHIQWLGATALEHRESLVGFKALYLPLFDLVTARQIFTPPDFWRSHEEIHGLLARARSAWLDGNRIEARFAAVKLVERANQLLREVDSMALSAFA